MRIPKKIEYEKFKTSQWIFSKKSLRSENFQPRLTSECGDPKSAVLEFMTFVGISVQVHHTCFHFNIQGDDHGGQRLCLVDYRAPP